MDGQLDVLVIGAGPTGLACAIEATRSNFSVLVVEKGCLVNSIFSYPPGMTFFTTRERLEIGDIPFPSINVKPTRAEALEYYRGVAEFYHVPVHFQERVAGVVGSDGNFEIHASTSDGDQKCYRTRKVIIATGYYDIPNLMGVPGEDLPKVSHYYGEAHAFYQRKVAVIGGANSAAIAALDLFRHGAEVTLIHWEPELSRHIKYWIRPDIENRIKEGSIRACMETTVKEITQGAVWVESAQGGRTRIENDYVFALTGYHPDFEFLRRVGIEIDPKTSRPNCDPKTRESNVPGVYLAGVVISGRHTNEIFIENGRFHGKQIVTDIQKHLGGLAPKPEEEVKAEPLD
ncbi:MAG: YpdA family putative bacillithiol disulfide reductase [Acidobacteria bacterium]|nr:MAG: YpdA family putative bacillithiol disulfide reductase [Acidobacteriota bacterium]